ncbi:hypothetical protein BU24DRAFT_406978 [Aaosphaeria arxii CBS 175.79]|uniref:BTB domain-containing protein n=1 Tax=Aaosphaeria arxii CBS 175.79 TaxID=1450172 RepID=A0A6A5XVB9_9PLEO|nr:uncharacterized protein BU24DRAFT_406978 [Aaosphaeria arxii CBS 175.79]KAF2016883.1 hypothetical protein BU24DRAFT_406978 [Aaosphaeria arxii CBS 175.79]
MTAPFHPFRSSVQTPSLSVPRAQGSTSSPAQATASSPTPAPSPSTNAPANPNNSLYWPRDIFGPAPPLLVNDSNVIPRAPIQSSAQAPSPSSFMNASAAKPNPGYVPGTDRPTSDLVSFLSSPPRPVYLPVPTPPRPEATTDNGRRVNPVTHLTQAPPSLVPAPMPLFHPNFVPPTGTLAKPLHPTQTLLLPRPNPQPTKPVTKPAGSAFSFPPVIRETVTLHEWGDVTLIVGERKRRVLVSSSMMRRASPVWRAMFSKNWIEGSASEVEFPDDNEDAMLLVLRIAHLHFSEIPAKGAMWFGNLVQLAVVCDKYDLVGLVRPFVDLHGWVRTMEPHLLDKGREEMLFVSWTFGYLDHFERLAKHLAMTIRIQRVPYGVGQESIQSSISELNLPPDIAGSILDLRNDTIDELLEMSYKLLQDVRTKYRCKAGACTIERDDGLINLIVYTKSPSEYTPACNAIVLGSLIKGLDSLYLSMGRKVRGRLLDHSSYTGSVSDLYEHFKRLKIHHLELGNAQAIGSIINGRANLIIDGKSISGAECRHYNMKPGGHEKCAQSVNLVERAGSIIAKMRSPVLDSHREHIAIQAKK